jgi:hypothetical protein
VVLGEVLDDGQGRGRLLEEVKDQVQGVPDLFVGVEGHPALRIVDQPRGRPGPELALGGLLQLAAQEAAAEQAEFGLAHGPEEPQEETVGVLETPRRTPPGDSPAVSRLGPER